MPSIRPYETAAGRRYLVRYYEGKKARAKGGFARRRDADRFAADLHQRKTMGQLYEARPETLGAFLDAWLDRYSLRVRPSTHQRRVEALRALHDALRARPLPELRAADVEDAVVAVGARAPRQAQLALASLKLALRDARKRGQQFDQAILELKPPRSRERATRFLAWPEVEHLAGYLPDAEARLVMVAALTGLRQGELFNLTWGDVDLEAGVLRVREGKTQAARRSVDLAPLAVELLREQEKDPRVGAAHPEQDGGPRGQREDSASGRARPVKAALLVSPAPAGLLEEQVGRGRLSGKAGLDRGRLSEPREVSAAPSTLARQQGEHERGRTDTRGQSGVSSPRLVFPAPAGGRWNAANFMHRLFRPAVKAAGLDGLSFHSLRHSYASLMVAAGVNVKVIADQLGHSDGGALVLRRYGHLYSGAGREAALALERVVRA